MSKLFGIEDAKNILTDKAINQALLENGITKLAREYELLLVHDGSDIRKEHARQLESLGKVRDLDGDIINGYSSFNTIALDITGKDVTLLNTEIYSNGDPEFISQKDLRLVAKPLSKKATPEQAEYYASLQHKVSAASHLNSAIVARQQIKKVSNALKKNSTKPVLTHVMDRGADDDSLFSYIAGELKDQFVIRLKASRNAMPADKNKPAEKLVAKSFSHKYIKYYSKIQIKTKAYQNASSVIEWGEQLNGFNVIRVQLLTSDGKPIFKQPMLLITNQEVTDAEHAVKIYHIYLQRSKIEGVFKFLKDVLGWEDSQIRSFTAIKTILAFCYFVAGYFYEIESALIENEVIQFFAYLGNGKGKVTRNYVLQGFAKIINKTEVDEAMEKFNITPDQLKQIIQMMLGNF